MTGLYMNRADDPVRALSEMVGERIAASLAGRKRGEVGGLEARDRVRRPGEFIAVAMHKSIRTDQSRPLRRHP